MTSAGRRAGTAALVLALLAALVLVGGALTGSLRTSAVLTGSMTPYAPSGAAVLSVAAPASAVRAGDVVTLRAPAPWSTVVTHRVVRAEPRDGAVVLTTKGDRNEDVDPWQATVRDARVHRAVLVVPHLGTAVTTLSGQTGDRARDAAVWALALAWLGRLWWPRRQALEGWTLRSPFFDVSSLPTR